MPQRVKVASPKGNLMKLGTVSFIRCSNGTLKQNLILATDSENLFLIRPGSANPLTKGNGGKALGLYRSFHGAEPKGARRIQLAAPRGPLNSLGEVQQINYRPGYPSQHTGTEFYHKSGDTGSKEVPNNLVLAKDQNNNYFLIKMNPDSRYPYVSERGIIG